MSEHAKQTKGFVVNCDIGVLITPDDEEFEAYASVYDRKYGYYDYSQTAYRREDLDKAIAFVKTLVAESDNMTYGVITDQGYFNYGDDFDNYDFIGQFTYLSEDVVYSAAKINGKIVENFIKEVKKA